MKISKPLLFIFIFFSVFILFAAYRYLDHGRTLTLNDKLKDMAAIADLKAADIAAWRYERIADASVIASNPLVEAALAGRAAVNPVMREWLDTFRTQYQYQEVLVVDKRGRSVLASPPDGSVTPATWRSIKDNNQEKVFFTPFYKRADGTHYLAVLAQVSPTMTNAAAEGFVVLTIDPAAFLYPYLQLWPSPSASGETILVERKGDEVLFLNEPRHRKGSASGLRLPLSGSAVPAVKGVLERKGEMEGIDYRGIPVLAAFRPVRNSGWVVVAKIDSAEVYSPLRQRQILLGALVATLLGGSLSTLLFISRRSELHAVLVEKDALEKVDRARGELLEAERRVAEALRESEALFRQLAETLPQLVWMTRPDGYPEYFNHRWYEYTGAAPGKIAAGSWKEYLHPDDRSRTSERWAESLRTGNPYHIEYRIRRGSDGSYRWFLTRALPMHNDKGETIRWFGTCTDIHDRIILENEREMLMHTISHDLRTPLSATQGFIQLAMLDVDGAVRSLLDAAQEGTFRMNAMIQDLVDAARLEGGELTLNRMPVHLQDFLKKMLEGSATAIDISRIRVDLPVELPAVWADPTRLERVFLNLLTNGLKFSSAGSQIDVYAEAGEDHVLVGVRDRGRGIDPDDLPHIFERFYRVKEGRKAGGVGLGLYIVQKLVEAHNGRIWAESEIGRGSTFFFTLPQKKQEPSQ